MTKGEISWYIVALILGIAIIAVLGYWFFVLSGKGQQTGSEAECQSKLFAYCAAWSLSDYTSTTYPGNWDTFAPRCKDVSISGIPPSRGTCETLLKGKQ